MSRDSSIKRMAAPAAEIPKEERGISLQQKVVYRGSFLHMFTDFKKSHMTVQRNYQSVPHLIGLIHRATHLAL
jgi:hypothetical protein